MVKDSKGESSTTTLKIEVGNEMPVIDVDFAGNLSFYRGAEAINYKVTVRDKEDGSTEDGQIPADKVGIHFNYLPHGKDLALLGPDQFSAPSKFIKGQNLIEGSDCRSCHSKDQKSIGPTYLAVAKRYAGDQNAVDYLGKKIIEGGNGNWGHSLMAAHPQHTLEETSEMVKYILSLSEEGGSNSGNLPLTGSIETSDHIGRNDDQGVYVFSVSYKDLGSENTGALTATKSIILYPAIRQAEDYDEISGAKKERPRGGDLSYVRISPQGGHLVFHQLDLTQIHTLTFRLKSTIASGISVKIEGKEIGRTNINPEDGGDWRTLSVDLLPAEGIHDIHIAFDKATQGQRGSVMLDWVKFGD